MQNHIYETKVLENGILKIPEIKNIVNHKVKIILIDENENSKEETMAFKNFLKKWMGIIKGVDSEKLRFEYLMEKYK